jgi:rhodanese-related sulfurtransferase
MAVLVTAAAVAGFASNAVRATLEWRGNDPTLLKQKVAGVTVDEAAPLLDDAATLFLDVRPAAAFATSRIRGAVGFSADDFAAAYESIHEFLGPEIRIIAYGEDALPAARAAQFLGARGHAVQVMEGGFTAWRDRGLPIDAEPAP